MTPATAAARARWAEMWGEGAIDRAGEQMIDDVLEAASPSIAAQALRDAADLVDRGPTFPLPPTVISALLRERADDLDGSAGSS